jgi:hypothetical protein
MEFRQFDRRRATRHAFGGVAELTDTQSGKYVVCRATQLSRFGCFVRTNCAFAPLTIVNLKITHHAMVLQVLGKVVYVRASEGMAIDFEPLAFESRTVLESWLSEVTAATRVDEGLGTTDEH